MSASRQLAAIMVTDIVSYTALMGEDELKAFKLLRKNRQIQQPVIKHFNSTCIKKSVMAYLRVKKLSLFPLYQSTFILAISLDVYHHALSRLLVGQFS